MRSTIIPAQITTVEDKIAGNLNFTQMILLMLPILWSLLIYSFISPQMHLTPLKIVLIVIFTLISVILSIRLKGHILLDWLLIYGRYSLRPSYYVFDKNDLTRCRQNLITPALQTKNKAKPAAVITSKPSVKHLISLDQLLRNSQTEIHIRPIKEGGINVAYQQVDR